MCSAQCVWSYLEHRFIMSFSALLRPSEVADGGVGAARDWEEEEEDRILHNRDCRSLMFRTA